MNNEVEMKDWKSITRAEKMNINFLKKQRQLYEDAYRDPNIMPSYIKICDEITKIEVNIRREIDKLEKEELKKKVEEDIKKNTRLKINASMLDIDEIIETFNIWQVGSGNLCWYLQEQYTNEYGERPWSCLRKDTLLARFPALNVFIRGEKGEPDFNSFTEFTTKIIKQNRLFNNLVQSWTRPTGNGYLNILDRNFCKPNENGETDYHWFIDALFESVSGGLGADKKDHMEQIFLAKWQHPENIFLPNIFCNDNGQTGKGLTTDQFATRLFGGSVAMNCSMDHLTGKFNSSIAGKALIAINETTRENVDQQKLKAFLGSPVFKVERKFENVVDADNCALLFSSANGSGGSVTLSGAGSDRRFSIFSSKTNINTVVARYFLEKENKKITLEQAKIWIESEGQHILHSELQVGKWICAKTKKYGEIKHLQAIKGEAYNALLNRQRGAWLDTVESIFTDENFVYIREALLRELVVEYNKKEVIPGKKTFNESIEKLCADKGINVVLVLNASIIDPIDKKIIHRTIWKKDDKTKTVEADERMYREVVDPKSGRAIWKWIA